MFYVKLWFWIVKIGVKRVSTSTSKFSLHLTPTERKVVTVNVLPLPIFYVNICDYAFVNFLCLNHAPSEVSTFSLLPGRPCALFTFSTSLSFYYLCNLPSWPLGTKLSVVLTLKSKERICREEIRLFLICVSLTDTISQLPER